MLLPALAITLAAGVAPALSLPTRLTVQLIRRCPPAAACAPPDVLLAMKRETERIWSGLGVELVWFELVSARPPAHPTPDLVVMFEEHPNPIVEGSDRHNLVLGRMHQPATPCDPGVAQLWVAHVRQQVETTYVNGLPLISAPTRFGHVLLARALGRTLAHEIGHYLLGPAHARSGLMRPQFTPRELIETRGRYDLDDANRSTLTARRSERTLRRCAVADVPTDDY
jgi:hypothetical protein